MPNEIVRWISSARCSRSVRVYSDSRRLVRIAALPHAMSKPTPTTLTWSRYAATPPIGITYPRCPSAMSATRSARLATSRSCASILSSCVPKITGSVMVHRLSLEMHRPSVCACACPDSNRDAKARRSERRVSANSTTGAYETNRSSCPRQVRPAGLEPATSSFGGSRSAPAELRTLALSLLESNQRPRVYQTRALPTELRDIAKRLEGVEPPASGFVARRSLRLSYRRTVQK